jgi:large subunit ribosomal protein L4
MAKVKLYNQLGEEIGLVELKAALFEVKIKPSLVHRAAVAQAANSRQVLAHTKGRGEVRGGGHKPRPQKGTGQSRQSSIRSPLWVGGGVTFGPTKERNFHLKLNRAERRLALAMVLSDKVANDKFVVVDSLVFPEIRTKPAAALLKKISPARRVLVVVEAENKTVQKAFRNIVGVSPISVKSLNVVDILANEIIVVSQAAVEDLEKNFNK